jgi:ribosomal protein S18 acetylase RimI-like enzyme
MALRRTRYRSSSDLGHRASLSCLGHNEQVTEGKYWKVPFELEGTRSDLPDNENLGVGWRTAIGSRTLEQLVGSCLAASVDARDATSVEQLGPIGAARLVLADTEGFSHDPSWWEMVTIESEEVGFVLPALYDGCARDGLDEATIFHIGVLPAFRGRGLARVLLRRATRTLLDHGVWRIYCDTAADNASMIHLFEADGWKRLPPHERPTFSAAS